MQRALQKLVRNGNSTQVTIPRQFLVQSGLLPGQQVIVELLDDNSLRVRSIQDGDFAPRHPRITYLDQAPAVPR